MEFRDQLICLRKRQGWSQEELGFKLDVSRQTVSKWESGDTTPEMNKIILLSGIFNVTTDELLTGAAPPMADKDSQRNRSWGYEYKSPQSWRGLPLVHVNVGQGLRKAKGVVALGNIAAGIVAVGGISLGVVSLGAVSAGIISLACLSLGFISLGAVAAGFLAMGGIALGFLTFGGVAMGSYAVGGVALAEQIAIGGYAQGYLALGEEVRGTVTLAGEQGLPQISSHEFEVLVKETLPKTKPYILKILSGLFKP